MGVKKYDYEDIFNVPEYQVGDTYLHYADEIKKAEEGIGKVEDFKGTYSEQIDKAVSDYLGRDKFNFNPNNSSTYQQIRNQYLGDGKRAMEDTLASGALLSGGYNNSAAQVAGQQVYNDYAKRVTDSIPTLENQEYERYLNDINQKLADIDLLKGLDDSEYNKYLDEINQGYQHLSHLTNMQQTAASLDASKNSFDQGNWSTLAGLVQNDKFQEDEKSQNAMQNYLNTILELSSLGVDVKVTPELEKAGYTQEMFDSLTAKANTPTVSYSGSDDDTPEVEKANSEALSGFESELLEKIEGSNQTDAYNWAYDIGAEKYGLSDDQFLQYMNYYCPNAGNEQTQESKLRQAIKAYKKNN